MKIFIYDNGWKGAFVVKADSKEEAIEKIKQYRHIQDKELNNIINYITEMTTDVVETVGDC